MMAGATAVVNSVPRSIHCHICCMPRMVSPIFTPPQQLLVQYILQLDRHHNISHQSTFSYQRTHHLCLCLHRVFRILKNWPERNVRLVCVTDGEQVGALGDLGVQAIGVPLSKLSLHTACGGVEPAITMPVVIDVGTDNEELLRRCGLLLLLMQCCWACMLSSVLACLA